jgi:hypothetical protein
MAFTSAQLSAMEDAYARGVTSVRHGDKTVTYGTLADLWLAILRIRRALASPRYLGGVIGYRKGL